MIVNIYYNNWQVHHKLTDAAPAADAMNPASLNRAHPEEYTAIGIAPQKYPKAAMAIAIISYDIVRKYEKAIIKV